MVIAEDEQFHQEHLCVRRKKACRWNVNGCDEILGPPEVRIAHEDVTCIFRLIECRNACDVQGIVSDYVFWIDFHCINLHIHLDQLLCARALCLGLLKINFSVSSRM